MIRRLPVIPTVIVLAAVAVMLRLGFWQLDRLHEKEGELARLAQNVSAPAIAFPADRFDPSNLFRPATLDCRNPAGFATEGAGKAGYRIIATCEGGARVQLGTTRNPTTTVDWRGGLVSGSIGQAPDSRPLIVTAFDHSPRELMLVSDQPLAGLSANPPRSIAEVPNNHLSYAVQWFFFAAVALVIYLLALRKRLAAKDERG
ncbi:MAG: SURF1 family protein [Novosphingobium sp.]